ncbi:phage DNA ejection protein [Cronobacter sakazakii]|nr:phage DNA ejection protein [Cronobacter sakazakii]EKK5187271.1 phage DNA ejection protein [Cronobacter sakazakii]EKK5191188.1 phage DNA ejection protein [Cronobacter sakazakii]EKK5241675.1 phage DNA ejection protein [Cronobacter sakazakii]EKK5263747.1 phage DNA ejection protein [Cronobacter sakazakii]
MATWDMGNGGSLLAGLGGINSNAPSVNDSNAALALIRDNNEIQRSGANNIGLQALQGIGNVTQVQQQAQQQQRQQEFQQAYSAAYATGDRNAMRKLAVQYPEQFDAVRNGMGFIDEDQRNTVGNLAAGARLASSSPDAMANWLQSNAGELARVGVNPQDVAQMYQQNPQQFGEFVDHLGLTSLGPEKYFDAVDKMAGREIDKGKLAEQIRSNKAGEGLQAQQIAVSRQNSLTSAYAPTSAMQNYAQYAQMLKTDPAAAAIFAQAAGINTGPEGSNRLVQLSDGRTVKVSGKVHGAGANAFYEGVDDNGNMVRVPTSAISAPPSSAATAQNYAMKKDLDAIESAGSDQLDFMTGVTGYNGAPAFGADVRSRIGGKEQRQLYNAAQRIQGRMQNQGIAAARDMGASGINTVAEAKMYFQGMPQLDFSSPDAAQQSVRAIREYTDNYNQQYNVSVGGKSSPQPAARATAAQTGSGYSSLWGD